MKELDNNEKLRERLSEFRKEYPISLAEISRKIGLGEKRYVLCNFTKRRCDLYEETFIALDEYLKGKGF